MEPLEAILEARRRASDHVTLEVESVALAETSETGGLHLCRVACRVLEVHRGSSPLRPGDPITVRLRCWHGADTANEPPGPSRIYHGAGTEPARIEVWGRFVGGELEVATFETVVSP